jgi:Domain of unknown function (DUF4292)
MKKKKPGIICILLLSFFLFSCSASRKLSKSREKLHISVASTSASNKTAADSLAKIIYTKVAANHILFNTFSGKMKIDFENDKFSQQDITANVRIQKDSAIWINLSAMLGIEVARVMITKDSIIIINRLKKSVYRRNLDYVQQLLHIPVNFSMLQNLLVGNPVYLSDTISDIVQTPSAISFTCFKDSLLNKTAVLPNDYLLQQCHLSQVDTSLHRSCDLTYSNYENIDNRNFPSKREIFVTSKTATNIGISFIKADFDSPVSFPFSIPDDYDEE